MTILKSLRMFYLLNMKGQKNNRHQLILDTTGNCFTTRVLPPRLTVRRGEIWDSEGRKTGQLDLVILRDDTPSLTFGEADAFLAEGVFGVIEVKSNLTKAKLQEALTTLRRVKSSKLLGGGAMITAGSVLNRPLRCIFVYEGATWQTLLQELSKPENYDVADLICILKQGAIISQGLLLKWEGNTPFIFAMVKQLL